MLLINMSSLIYVSFIKGVLTVKEVYEVLTDRGWVERFPLFRTVYELSSGLLPPSAIVEFNNKSKL